MSLIVTVDKNDTVLKVERPAGESRWRFKRKSPITQTHTRRLTEEQEQDIVTIYVDNPDLKVREIAEMYGITAGGVTSVLRHYDVPARRPTAHRKWSQPPVQDTERIDAAIQRVGDETLGEVVKDQASTIANLRLQVEALTRQVQDRDDTADLKELRLMMILERLSSVMNEAVQTIQERQMDLAGGDVLVELGKMRGLLEWAMAEVGR